MSKKQNPPASGSIDTPGITGVFTTGGNVVSPVEGLSKDAGLGKPPGVGEYGRPSEAMIPTGEKMPGGTGGGIKAYFKGHGGGKP